MSLISRSFIIMLSIMRPDPLKWGLETLLQGFLIDTILWQGNGLFDVDPLAVFAMNTLFLWYNKFIAKFREFQLFFYIWKKLLYFWILFFKIVLFSNKSNWRLIIEIKFISEIQLPILYTIYVRLWHTILSFLYNLPMEA